MLGFIILHETSFQMINIYSISESKSGFTVTVTLATQGVGVNQMWILKNSNDLFRVHTIKARNKC
jgi:hypothetical protein